MSIHSVPTVKIAAPHVPGGFIVINATDLLPTHVIWQGDVSVTVQAGGDVPEAVKAAVKRRHTPKSKEA